MYNLYLLFKFIKHCILKRPLVVRTYSEYSYDDIKSIVDFPNMLYILRTQGGQKVVANLNQYKRYAKKKKIDNNLAGHILKWNFLGYETETPLIECKWKEFKSIYTAFFYPHLISGDKITSRLVANKLTSNEKESIQPIYLIR